MNTQNEALLTGNEIEEAYQQYLDAVYKPVLTALDELDKRTAQVRSKLIDQKDKAMLEGKALFAVAQEAIVYAAGGNAKVDAIVNVMPVPSAPAQSRPTSEAELAALATDAADDAAVVADHRGPEFRRRT